MYDIDLCILVKSYINSYHGWAVADQFEDTFNGEPFEDQNANALSYIKDSIEGLISSGLLAEDAQEELIEYRESLVVYLSK
jgi:hypothetical protein